MALSTAKLQTGILEDEKRIKQTVASLVSQLKVQADLMLALSTYEFDDLYNQGGLIADQSHIVDITAAFQAEYSKLPAIMDTFALIESFGNAANGATNHANAVADTTNNLNPVAFPDRYK